LKKEENVYVKTIKNVMHVGDRIGGGGKTFFILKKPCRQCR
jgi:hypothetical protein